MAATIQKSFVSLGMFIIDEFSFTDEHGVPLTDRTIPHPQIGGGGTYAAIGARIWLPSDVIGMIIDQGHDFPQDIRQTLLSYGTGMWLFRNQPHRETTRALNSYRGDIRGFEYTISRIRIVPDDLKKTAMADPKIIHLISSPSRASSVTAELVALGWNPITIFEPTPARCIPEQLPALKQVLHLISILSPNAEEAYSLLSRQLPVSKKGIEEAATEFLEFGIGQDGNGSVIIRSDVLGAYVLSRKIKGTWIDAFWTTNDADKVVDTTGAGNSFLGGLAAGLELTGGNVLEAAMYASVSASFVIEQPGLPTVTTDSDDEKWNGDLPHRRLEELRTRARLVQ